MTHPMSDQPDTPPTKRMTTAEVAALAQDIDGRLDDLSAVVTDVSTRLQEINSGTTSSTPTEWSHLPDAIEQLGNRVGHLEATPHPTHDQVDARIHEALAPLHDEVHALRGQLAAVESPSGSGIEASSSARLDGILARLEDAERKVAALDPGALVERVAAELHPTVADLRRAVANVEEAVKALDGDPVSHTLAEDALSDQIQAAVDRALKGRVGASAMPTASSAAPALNGNGAARKVLQLMRSVTHIGKEKEANLGERGGRFMFRGVDDAMDAVGHAMRDVGVILGTTVLKDETSQNAITKAGEDRSGKRYENTVVWTTTKLTVRYTFTDPDDGSTHAIEMVGEGRDASDKSTSKAASMALKYGLFQALMIPVTGLDDSDAAPPQRIEQDRQLDNRPTQAAPPAQQQAAPERTEQDKARRAGEALGAIRNVYRVEGGPQAQYNRLVQIMNQVRSEGLLEFVVEGSTLNQHGEATMRTLQAPPPPDDARASYAPPEPPEDYR